MVDHELDALKREFLAEAEEKVREMRTALGNGATRDSLERLTYLAHQLKGSGGSYGYQRISSDAAALEKAFESLHDGDGFSETIRGHVSSLENEIDERSRELAPA